MSLHESDLTHGTTQDDSETDQSPSDNLVFLSQATGVSQGMLWYYLSAGFTNAEALTLARASTPEKMTPDQQALADSYKLYFPHSEPFRFDEPLNIRDLKLVGRDHNRSRLRIYAAGQRHDLAEYFELKKFEVSMDTGLSGVWHDPETILTVTVPTQRAGNLRIMLADLIDQHGIKRHDVTPETPRHPIKTLLFKAIGPFDE